MPRRVFLRDDEGVFPASVDEVWEFISSGDRHAAAHEHRGMRRQLHAPTHGTYSWKQPFAGRAERFTMRWRSFPPLGVAYEVLEGPFAGSRFFLVYEPRGASTGVAVYGEFVSPTLPEEDLGPAVGAFFDLEFEQDKAALERSRRSSTGPSEPED